MIAIDTNILVYAHRPEFVLHQPARILVADLAGGPRPWAVVMHCLIEFAGAVSHPGRFRQPSSPDEIQDQISAWLESPHLILLEDSKIMLNRFLKLLRTGKATGAMVHDAHIAAACLAGGADELLTCDRDYARFPALATRNPFVNAD
ncbi:MAG: TA system VapC family ribonuclease toxin [Wenzhouxiangellaceae bacterium]